MVIIVWVPFAVGCNHPSESHWDFQPMVWAIFPGDVLLKASPLMSLIAGEFLKPNVTCRDGPRGEPVEERSWHETGMKQSTSSLACLY